MENFLNYSRFSKYPAVDDNYKLFSAPFRSYCIGDLQIILKQPVRGRKHLFT